MWQGPAAAVIAMVTCSVVYCNENRRFMHPAVEWAILALAAVLVGALIGW